MIAEVFCIPHGGSEAILRFIVDLREPDAALDDWTELTLQLGRHKARFGVRWQPEVFGT